MIHEPDGYFSALVAAETHSIHIDAPGYFPWTTRLFVGASGEYDFGDIHLERARTITGYVRDAVSGAPIADAVVRRSSRQYNDPYMRMLTINWFGTYHAASTDEHGKFVLGKLPMHADRLEVATEHGSNYVSLPAGVESLDIDVTLNGAVAGILMLPDGSPARGIVRLLGTAIPTGREVAEDGAFRWEGLAPGKYRLQAESEEGVVVSRSLTLGAGESAEDIQLMVDPGCRLLGLVSGLVGAERVEVEVREQDGRKVLQRSYRNGTYSLRGVPEKALVVARTTTDRELARRIRFGNRQELQMDLNFGAASRLSGHVVAGGQPLRAIDLRIVPKVLGTPKAYTTTTETGRYAVKGISDGRHVVQTRTGHSFEVDVAGSTTFNVELPLVSLLGTVRVDRAATPVRGGWARLTQVDPPGGFRAVDLQTQIASDGTFLFDGLVGGEYEVRISHPDFDSVSRRSRIAGAEVVELFLECVSSECVGRSSTIDRPRHVGITPAGG